MGKRNARALAFERLAAVSAVILAILLAAACTASRDLGEGRPITDYPYAVIDPETTDGWDAEAESVLGQSFFLLSPEDPRLEQSRVWKNACIVAIESHRGFWSTSASVEMQDFRTRRLIMASQMRRGGLYAGARGDVIDALRDVAAAKGPRGAAPVEVGDAEPASSQGGGSARTKAERLSELADLRAKGLITEAEYSTQRKSIIEER